MFFGKNGEEIFVVYWKNGFLVVGIGYLDIFGFCLYEVICFVKRFDFKRYSCKIVL